MLEAKNITFSYRKKEKALSSLSFSLEKGQVGVILGKNGSGKSTLIRILAGLEKKYQGEILLDGKETRTMKTKERAKAFSYLSQSFAPSNLTVYDTLALGRLPYSPFLPKKEVEPYLKPVIERLHLEEFLNRSLTELSGGERQRVMIAKALVQKSEVLLLDEPTSSLDLKSQVMTLELLKKEAKEGNISVFLSLHDVNSAFRYGDRFYLLKGGQLLYEGEKSGITEELLSSVYDVPLSLKEDTTGRYVILGGK